MYTVYLFLSLLWPTASCRWRMISRLSRLLHTGARWAAMDLRSVVGHLEALSPSSRAESWDNVGLLVEPSGNPAVHSVMLTTDLTEAVMDEAEGMGAGLVVAYHPPIFHSLKRLTQCTAKERIIVRALELKMAIYSPHTALDSIEGGVNDWLLQGLGAGQVRGLNVSMLSPHPPKLLTVCGLAKEAMAGLAQGREVTSKPSQRSVPSARNMMCPLTGPICCTATHLCVTWRWPAQTLRWPLCSSTSTPLPPTLDCHSNPDLRYTQYAMACTVSNLVPLLAGPCDWWGACAHTHTACDPLTAGEQSQSSPVSSLREGGSPGWLERGSYSLHHSCMCWLWRRSPQGCGS